MAADLAVTTICLHGAGGAGGKELATLAEAIKL
jgi:hypothetical protein